MLHGAVVPHSDGPAFEGLTGGKDIRIPGGMTLRSRLVVPWCCCCAGARGQQGSNCKVGHRGRSKRGEIILISAIGVYWYQNGANTRNSQNCNRTDIN
jgi:hypothetical protein